MDDIIVYGKSAEEHDENVRKTLGLIKESGLKLNREKCEFKKDRLTYFGHVLSADGVSPDPEKRPRSAEQCSGATQSNGHD